MSKLTSKYLIQIYGYLAISNKIQAQFYFITVYIIFSAKPIADSWLEGIVSKVRVGRANVRLIILLDQFQICLIYDILFTVKCDVKVHFQYFQAGSWQFWL